MPHVQRANRGRWHLGDGPLPLGRGVAAALVAVLAILILLLLLVQDAKGNFVYWANPTTPGSIGRAKINGTGANNNLIPGIDQSTAIAVDSKFIYWGEIGTNRIGRANLDGSGVNPNFITTGVLGPFGIAVTANSGIYWVNHDAGNDTVGHANIDGSNPVGSFFDTGSVDVCGLATDQSFVYWLNTSGGPLAIGRAPLSGAGPDPNFIPVPSAGCGVAVDGSFLYWEPAGSSIGRAPVGGGAANAGFIPSAATDACGVAVNSQYVFWGNLVGSPGANFVGRANINGAAPNPGLIAGAGQPCGLAAAPSNKVTVNSITRKKKKGTAIVNARVPGPGQVTLSQTPGTQDPNAIAAAVKQVGLTITGASSFKLPIKALGKTRKKLKKKGKAGVKAFVTFTPAGVAGVTNSQPVKTKLVKQRKRKK